MKNMFIEHIINRTLSTQSETPESMIIPNLSPNFGLYNSKMTQFTNSTKEKKEQLTTYFEPIDSVSSQKTEKLTYPETNKIENNPKSIIVDNEQSKNFKEDDIKIIPEKKTSNLTSTKNQIKERSQGRKNIVADKTSIFTQNVPSKKVTKKISPKSKKKEISLESSVVTNTEKHDPQITKNDMDSKSKQFNTSFTNDKPEFIDAVKQSRFVTNLKEISKKENITTKNIVQISENKINNVKLDVTKQTEQKINSNVSQIESKNDNKKKFDIPYTSTILIEPSNKTSPLFKNPSNLYVKNMKKNNTNIITINIDRIEVRANLTQKEKNNNFVPSSNKMSLSKYLQLRKEGVL